MKRWIKPAVFIGIIVIIILLIRFTVLGSLLSFENLVRYKDSLKALVSSNYVLAVLIFIAVYIAVTGLSIPGATILTIAAGFLFSTIPGAIIVNIGATAGACASFLASRYFIGSVIQERYGDKLVRFNEEIKSSGAGYLLTLRFIPAFPFFLINLLAGLTRIRLFTFFWTTSLGIIPGSLVYAYAGSNLAELKSVSGLLSWQILSVLLLLALFSILPVILRKLMKKKKENISPPEH